MPFPLTVGIQGIQAGTRAWNRSFSEQSDRCWVLIFCVQIPIIGTRCNECPHNSSSILIFITFPINIFIVFPLCAQVGVCVPPAHTWKSENNPQELVLSYLEPIWNLGITVRMSCLVASTSTCGATHQPFKQNFMCLRMDGPTWQKPFSVDYYFN